MLGWGTVPSDTVSLTVLFFYSHTQRIQFTAHREEQQEEIAVPRRRRSSAAEAFSEAASQRRASYADLDSQIARRL